MRLGILTQYYPPEMGAPQARLSELAAHVVRAGHEVTVLTAMPNYPAGVVQPGYGGVLRREWRDGARVLRTFIYPTQRADFAHRLTNYFSFVLSSAVAGTALLGRLDYLLVESPPLFLGLSGVWLAAVTRARLVFNVSDLWPESAVHLGVLRPGSAAHRASAALEALCYRRAWLVSGQSPGIVRSIQARFPDRRTFLLSNGVDTSRFIPHAATDQARRLVGRDGRTVALYAGLHGLAQGLGQLLDAAERLTWEDGIDIVLVGEGPEKPALLRRAEARGLRHVRFLPTQPRERMPALLAAADVVLVPLRTHLPGAVPSKLYEAMASGRPVALVATGEPADIVREHDAGVVLAPGDTDALVHALRRLRALPEERLRLGANGRRAVQAHFDRTRIASGFIDYLQEHLHERTGGAAAGRAIAPVAPR
ncbi:MAG TPA: glycosyltransferase family 4 protein [Gemmatimonadaceae bacterium]|nr:glycosyltransferase family 4 protein [Gemmatimonadaceae bacterium]